MACEHGMMDSTWCPKCIAATKAAKKEADRAERAELRRRAAKSTDQFKDLGVSIDKAAAALGQIGNAISGGAIPSSNDKSWQVAARQFIYEWCSKHKVSHAPIINWVDSEDSWVQGNLATAALTPVNTQFSYLWIPTQKVVGHISDPAGVCYVPELSIRKSFMAISEMSGKLGVLAADTGAAKPALSIQNQFPSKFDSKCKMCGTAQAKGQMSYGSVVVPAIPRHDGKPIWICGPCAFVQRIAETTSGIAQFMPQIRPKRFGSGIKGICDLDLSQTLVLVSKSWPGATPDLHVMINGKVR